VPTAPALTEVAEVDLVRHFTRLSQRNYGVDTGFYPLGSCSMKYNPKLAEDVAAMPGFRRLHPLQPESQIQGALQLLVELERALLQLSEQVRQPLLERPARPIAPARRADRRARPMALAPPGHAPAPG